MRRQVVVGLLSGVLLGFLGSAWAEERPARMERAMDTRDKATFAGGCFWCMEHPFDDVDGVITTTVGYAGGPEVNPRYQQVASGQTGHAEAIEVVYDPAAVTYARLLEVFWRNIDPTTLNKQFADVGTQYRTAIFYHTDEQRRAALESKEQLGRSGKFTNPIVTEITPASAFYPAEEDHQEYYKKHPIRYRLYRVGSGRDRFLKRVWGSSADTPGDG